MSKIKENLITLKETEDYINKQNESFAQLTKKQKLDKLLFELPPLSINKIIKSIKEGEKIKDLPEYSTLSELAYILDKKSLLKLCEYFGGITMTIPTIEDLENLTKSLLLNFSLILSVVFFKSINIII